MGTLSDLVIGVDCSTTACKAIVWDLAGKVVAEGRAPLSLHMPRPSWHEQDAAQWWSTTAQAVREAVADVAADRLAALCIVAQRETFVLVDETGRPLRTAIVWMDERARSLVPAIDEMFGGARFHQITGKPLSGNLTLTKLLWLKQNELDILTQAHKILDVHAFLIHCLTGTFRTSWGCADPTGLFDMRSDTWASELLQLVGVRDNQMADAVAPGTVIGEVTAQAAALCGLLPGLPVVAGLGDGQAAGVGANITGPGMAYLNLGTAVVSGTFTDRYVVDRSFRTMYGGVPGTYSLETVIIGGTYTVSWFVREFAAQMIDPTRPGAAEEAMESACRAVPPGALGLILVPYWNSAMNPYWDASASGIVIGWCGVHGKAHLYRAILEGIAFEQRLHTAGIEAALGRAVDSFVTIGGGARSALWRQIIADVTGKPVERAATDEAAALGAGILAASGVGLFSGVREAAAAMSQRSDVRCEPDAANYSVYTRLYDDVYRHLYPALQPYLKRLTELTEGTV